MIAAGKSGNWNISNLGAVLFAKKLSDFRTLKRKAVRVILYKGENRVETVREQEGTKGYATGFEGLIGFVTNLLPSNEVIGQALKDGNAAFTAKNFDLAISKYDEGIAADPDFVGSAPVLLNNRGAVFR